MIFLSHSRQLSKQIFMGLIALFITFSSIAETTGKYGLISKNQTKFPINDIVFRVDKSRNELAVFLSAAPLTEEVRQGFKQGESMGRLLFDKPSPDTNKWQWFPYAMIEMTFDGTAFTTDKIKRFYFKGFGLEEANFTDNINGMPNDDFVFQHAKLDKDKLTLVSNGKVEQDNLFWQINIQE